MLTPPPISFAPFTCRVLTAVLNADRSLSNSAEGAIYIADIHLASVWITTIFTFDATPAFVHSTVISDAATPLTCLLLVDGVPHVELGSFVVDDVSVRVVWIFDLSMIVKSIIFVVVIPDITAGVARGVST